MTQSHTEAAVLPQPLKLWEKIVVVVGDGADAGRYASRIEDFSGDGLVITEPQFISGHTLLRDGVAVTIQLTRGDAIYQFGSHIRRRPGEKHGQAFLNTPRDFRRVQRRLFVRLSMNERIQYVVVTPKIDWLCWEHGLKWSEATTVDVSGGGMRIVATDDIAVGTVLLVRIPSLKREGLPEFLFAVCRRIMSEKSGKSLGLEFVLAERLNQTAGAPFSEELPVTLTQFNHAAQNRLVVWIFNRQIVLRQKGLL